MAAAAITSAAKVPDGVPTLAGSNSGPGVGPALSALPAAIAGLEPSPAAAHGSADAAGTASAISHRIPFSNPPYEIQLDDPARIAALLVRLLPPARHPREGMGRAELLLKVAEEAQSDNYFFAHHIADFDEVGLNQCVQILLSSPLFQPQLIGEPPQKRLPYAYDLAAITDNLSLYHFMRKHFPGDGLYGAIATLLGAIARNRAGMVAAIGDTPGIAEVRSPDIFRTCVQSAMANGFIETLAALASLKTMTVTKAQMSEMARKREWATFDEELEKAMAAIDDKKGA